MSPARRASENTSYTKQLTIILTVNTPTTVDYYLHGLICHIGYGVAGQPPEDTPHGVTHT